VLLEYRVVASGILQALPLAAPTAANHYHHSRVTSGSSNSQQPALVAGTSLLSSLLRATASRGSDLHIH